MPPSVSPPVTTMESKKQRRRDLWSYMLGRQHWISVICSIWDISCFCCCLHGWWAHCDADDSRPTGWREPRRRDLLR